MDRRIARFAAVLLVGACGGIAAPSLDATPSPDAASAPAPSQKTGSADASRGAAESRSFDPRGYDSSCATTSDCMLAPIINDCFTCCGFAAVNAAAAQTNLAAVERACSTGGGECTMGCAKSHAQCNEGQCIACTGRQCEDGVIVEVTVAKVGTHVLEAVIDGSTVGCTIELPVSGAGPAKVTCAPEVELFGGITPGSFAGTLRFRTKSTGAITFRAKHDGQLVGEKTFVPVYVAEPGPNGPQCEPKECFVARETFP